ncbi:MULTISPECIES: YndJ family protein [unclassified Haladaptatus]|uniref:YndJ family protein n=1 Tax=unclassified Haladaptatus TaxID=2622732 RepID=UPI00209C31D9|nr:MULTISPECIES: YndJ family protein [unclassified Haladaptatus]
MISLPVDTAPDRSALLGAVIWLVVPVLISLGRIAHLFLLAPLVLVPLVLPMLTPDSRTPLHRIAILGQPFGAVLVALSFVFSPGLFAGVLVLPWLATTVTIALLGFARLLPRGFRPLEELCLNAGLLYIAVGGCWLLISRLGANPLGFGDAIVFFTAVHFHYAGFALPVVVGVTGRAIDDDRIRRFYRPIATVVVFGPGLIAIGISLSPIVEVASVTVLTLSVMSFALLLILGVVPTRSNRRQQVSLIGAAVAVGISMLFALGYGLFQYLGTPITNLSIGRMVQIHGHLNALGFALLGIVGWRLSTPPPRFEDPTPSIPFSSLTSTWRVGNDYVERTGIEADGGSKPVGQVDDFSTYARHDFDTESVHTAVRNFYERTSEYTLSYRTHWHRGFRLGARIAALFTGSFEQLNLPTPETASKTANSRIIDIDDRADGRENVRAWVRTDSETGSAVFVAAYSTHEYAGETYMNVSLPLPGLNLSGILRIDSLDSTEHEGAIRLTSKRPKPGGHSGLYLVTPFVPIRLPMHEVFRVWSASDTPATTGAMATSETTLIAQHEMWLFGRQFLTIDYAITPTASSKTRTAEPELD